MFYSIFFSWSVLYVAADIRGARVVWLIMRIINNIIAVPGQGYDPVTSQSTLTFCCGHDPIFQGESGIGFR